jgi:hypothetical protein
VDSQRTASSGPAFETPEELVEGLLEFRQRSSSQLFIEQLHFQPRQQAHQALLALEPAA